MSLVCLCIYVTYMLIYAMLDNSHNMQRTHLNITAGSMIQVIISKGKQVNPKGAVSLHLRLIPSEFMQWKNKNKNTALVQLYWAFAKTKDFYA